jgi:transglutaminase-like putative cysteine protease
MKLLVRHETRYDYDEPLAYAAQRLYLTPVDFAAQKILGWSIDAPGIENALTYLDGFGNPIHLVTYRNWSGTVRIIAEGSVETTDAAGVVSGLRSPTSNAIFLRQTAATEPSPAISALARKIEPSGGALIEELHSLMALIHSHVVYETGTTNAHTTAAQAYADGRGVCQDHAHIFIGVTRSLGIPSRYVTGYLLTGEGASSTAAHAWAEVLVPNLGWVGFDPANCKCPTDQYVRMAGGIDALGVTPIRGSRRGGGTERMEVDVRVEAA